MDPVKALGAAIRACRGICDPTPLERAVAALAEPWTVAVVGRVGAGKSTLVHAWTGVPRATGLGGVTRSLEVVEADGIRLLDTPGIDDVDTAQLGLEPIVEGADGVVWVTDGLQPWTATERELAGRILVPGRPFWIVVSRVDLVPADEVPAVLERVTTLSRALGPRAVLPVDLRGALRGGAGRPRLELPRIGPRRAEIVRAAVAEVRAALEASPRVLAPEEVLALWRARVRAVVAELEAALERDGTVHPTEALASLGNRAEAVIDEVSLACRPVPPPVLPRPAAPSEPLGRQLLGRLAGVSGALRVVRGEGARWLADGEAALTDGWVGAERLRAAAAARSHLVATLDAVGGSL